jgi:hypothetical protein
MVPLLLSACLGVGGWGHALYAKWRFPGIIYRDPILVVPIVLRNNTGSDAGHGNGNGKTNFSLNHQSRSKVSKY